MPKPIARNHADLIRDIEKGECQLPRFQRDFVWSKEQAAALIDSLIKGFPIGAFILWKTKERMRAHKKFGGVILESPPPSDFVHYVLDGQQRLTSIFLAVRGIALDGDNPRKDYGRIYVDLDPKKFRDGNEELCVVEEPARGIAVHQLVTADFAAMRRIEDRHGRSAAELADKIRKAIDGYEFATVEIQDQPLGAVAEMFTRINTGGRELTLFEIVNAKVYQEGEIQNGEVVRQEFDLEEEIDDLTEDLKRVSYDTLTENKTIVLQTAAAVIGRDVRKKTILDIPPDKFVSAWDETMECLQLAVDKVRGYFRVRASKLLPYPGLLAPLAYFYSKNDRRQPDNDQVRQLGRFFYRAAFSRRYSSAVETKMNQDLRLMEEIAAGRPVDIAAAIPLPNESEEYFVRQMMEDFRSSDAFAKAVLCIMAERGPKRLNDNSPVELDNSYLHIATSRNYHHFFPKSRVKENPRANALANIVFVDDYLNKRVIGSKMPSDYIGKFRRENPDIVGALDSHFIALDDFVSAGKDDFKKFLEMRARRLAREILGKIGGESEENAEEGAPSREKPAGKEAKCPVSHMDAPEKGGTVLEGWHVSPPGSVRRNRRIAVGALEKGDATDVNVQVLKFAEDNLPDLVVVKDEKGEKAWATHEAALNALRSAAKIREGLQNVLLPGFDKDRRNCQVSFWSRAPASSRPSVNEMDYGKAPKGEWAYVSMADADDNGRGGDICHLPTLSHFRFWNDNAETPTLMEARRGARVKSAAEWESLCKAAPRERAKLEKNMDDSEK